MRCPIIEYSIWQRHRDELQINRTNFYNRCWLSPAIGFLWLHLMLEITFMLRILSITGFTKWTGRFIKIIIVVRWFEIFIITVAWMWLFTTVSRILSITGWTKLTSRSTFATWSDCNVIRYLFGRKFSLIYLSSVVEVILAWQSQIHRHCHRRNFFEQVFDLTLFLEIVFHLVWSRIEHLNRHRIDRFLKKYPAERILTWQIW